MSDDRQNDAAIETLSALSSYLGCGLGDEHTTAEQFDARIRWGIDYQTSAILGMIIDRIRKEAMSETPDLAAIELYVRSLIPMRAAVN